MSADPKSLKRRTMISFAVLFVFLAAGIYGFNRVQASDQIEGVQAPYRHVLEFNGRIWKALFNAERLNKSQPPLPGTTFRVNGDLGLSEPIDNDHWAMTLITDNDVPNSRRLQVSLNDLRALPRSDSSSRLYCIEGWSEPLSYGGIKFSDFMIAYGIKPKAYVGLVTVDGEYYVSVDMASMLHSQTLLAFELNGLPLKPENGAPLRLVIPIKYGIKSLKRIGTIFFSDQRPPDYWAERGYDWFAGL